MKSSTKIITIKLPKDVTDELDALVGVATGRPTFSPEIDEILRRYAGKVTFNKIRAVIKKKYNIIYNRETFRQHTIRMGYYKPMVGGANAMVGKTL